MNESGNDNYLSVPISENLISELMQKNPSGGVRALLEDIAWDYLERTSEKGDIFQSENKGIKWGRLYLPGGTRLMMEYRGIQKFATVTGNAIEYMDSEFESPSKLANYIANGTSRNAWRDFWIKRPNDREWIQADQLRLRNEGKQAIDLEQLFHNKD